MKSKTSKSDSAIIPISARAETNISLSPFSIPYIDSPPQKEHSVGLTKIMIVTSYPPRVCGIATYSQDLVRSLNNKFSHSLAVSICALETGDYGYAYPEEVKTVLNTSNLADYKKLAATINNDKELKIVLIQHEFGFFREQELAFLTMLYEINKPLVVVFHTVLPHPDELMKANVKNIAMACESVVVMTKTSQKILAEVYEIPPSKIAIIAHGTHLVPHLNRDMLKRKYGLKNRKVLITFGLLSSGKRIETTIEALPAIVSKCPEVVFLVIGKTHPEVLKSEGEAYRKQLEDMVIRLHLTRHVIFINNFLALPILLEYLQLTDIYLFTTNDPNQAVSGTFSYAMSCACPIISTPIPHAREVLTEDTGIIIDFKSSEQMAEGALKLLNDENLRNNISTHTLEKIVSTAWENSAVGHAKLFEKIAHTNISIRYNLPPINLDHLKKLTTRAGIIQFSKINQPDFTSGYTLDDNARALVAISMHYKLTKDKNLIDYIKIYLDFIEHCQQSDGRFLNYIDQYNRFTEQNHSENLEDANGRAIWALGYVVSLMGQLPYEIITHAERIIKKAIPRLISMHSTRAMAFTIKGLYYHQSAFNTPSNLVLLRTFADRLVQMYKHESSTEWGWFESYLTYANSILSEAMLYAWLLTGEKAYRDIALSSFRFLLSNTFNENGIEVISNKKWLQKGEEAGLFGEQPIDVSYTVMTLGRFYDEFQLAEFKEKIEIAFNWFLGHNRLQQIVYNPCTGGCYDGLEETHVNLNQGAESTVSYLMARLTMEKYRQLSNPAFRMTGRELMDDK